MNLKYEFPREYASYTTMMQKCYGNKSPGYKNIKVAATMER